ncbi:MULTISPECIES: hypothetical protein [Caldicellulosiruptor]|uniref:hypothetical protein n=1 Tax=Caldicellulosiruptor TaxID=44000 RepID=UPI001650C836|nr:MULTISPECIES: hypothetical protein [Caldicellulosiruptor]
MKKRYYYLSQRDKRLWYSMVGKEWQTRWLNSSNRKTKNVVQNISIVIYEIVK